MILAATVLYAFIPPTVYLSSLVTHWPSIPGDCGSSPSEGEKFALFVFESLSHDCRLPSMVNTYLGMHTYFSYLRLIYHCHLTN